MGDVETNKGVIFCIKTCFRSVCRHPFLVGNVCFLIFLHKFFPFVFSLLVCVSPIFVSTAVLLGIILSYGQPNVPAIQKEDIFRNENVSRRYGILRNGSFDNVERFSEIRRDVVEKSIEEANSTATSFGNVGRDDKLSNDGARAANETSRVFHIDNKGSDADRKSPDTVFKMNDDFTELKEGDTEQSGIKSTNHRSHEMSLDQKEDKSSDKVDGKSRVDSNWKQNYEGEEDDDGDLSDSGSDRAESTSPDASMTDIAPVLDEIHPLLDGDAPQPAQMSTEVSATSSEISSKSCSETSNELDEDMENHGEAFEVTDVDDENADRDEDAKSGISWTDDDHKNAINLGTSDLERNQRLEDLIARRNLRKSMMRNLIDLDGSNLHFNVAHISTARRNPFDLPDEPNLPGSAPSVLAPRRSPFELPYDPGEEKQDMMTDDYEHVVTLQPKDHFFRRNETFNAGSSFFGTSKQAYNSRPYFVPHRMSSEGPSYSSVLRESSEHSESKASSEPETESLGSVEELEDNKPVDEDSSREPVVTTIAEHPSEDIGHGSESSEDEDTFKPTQVEKQDHAPDEIEVNVENAGDYQDQEPSLSKTANAATHREGDASEANEVLPPNDSSSTSLSEEHENVSHEKEGEQLSGFKPTMESSDNESTTQSVDDALHKEPVYDSSPRASEKNISSFSVGSDQQVEIDESSLPPVKRTISATEKITDVNNHITEKDTPSTETDEKLNRETSSENNTLLQSNNKLHSSDQSTDEEHSPVKHKQVQDSARCVRASEVQQFDKEIQQNSNSPTTSEAASTQSEVSETKATPGLPDKEDKMQTSSEEVLQRKFNNPSDTELVSEKQVLERTGTGPADSGEVPKRNAEEVISEKDALPDSNIHDPKQSDSRNQEKKHSEVHDGEARPTGGAHALQSSENNPEKVPNSKHEKVGEAEVDKESSIKANE